jgi:hypothetical protein
VDLSGRARPSCLFSSSIVSDSALHGSTPLHLILTFKTTVSSQISQYSVRRSKNIYFDNESSVSHRLLRSALEESAKKSQAASGIVDYTLCKGPRLDCCAVTPLRLPRFPIGGRKLSLIPQSAVTVSIIVRYVV